MHFTVVFDSQERLALAFGLVFKPTPVWVHDEEELIILRRDHAAYVLGDLRRLLEQPTLQRQDLLASRKVAVVVHDSGYGTERDLTTLVTDLQAESFEPRVVPLDDSLLREQPRPT